MPQSDKQPIAAPGETAEWQWSVSATEPGDYELALTVTTFQGDTDRALEPSTREEARRQHNQSRDGYM